MKRIYSFLLICLLCALCGCHMPEKQKNDTLQIVTTNFPAYDFARQIAGGYANISMLLAPGEESHTFEPTPQDMITLTKADLFILGGGKSDSWALRLLESSEPSEDKTLKMMDCTNNISNASTEEMHHAKHAHTSQDHSQFYAYDEHVWTSPQNAMVICEKIAEKLILADSAHAAAYSENLKNYLNNLSLLDASFSEIVENAPHQTMIFADRFPFRYFADRYNLTYFAAFPGCSGETEPDASTMKFLIDKVNTESIPVVFYTELSNRKIADAICEATNAKQLLFHSCHTVTKDEFERGETYVSLMEQNAAALKEALS